jgi:hypothetical protein
MAPRLWTFLFSVLLFLSLLAPPVAIAASTAPLQPRALRDRRISQNRFGRRVSLGRPEDVYGQLI